MPRGGLGHGGNLCSCRRRGPARPGGGGAGRCPGRRADGGDRAPTPQPAGRAGPAEAGGRRRARPRPAPPSRRPSQAGRDAGSPPPGGAAPPVPAVAQAAPPPAPPPADAGRLTFPDDRPTFTSADGRFAASLGGQFQYDLGGYLRDSAGTPNNRGVRDLDNFGQNLRRGRLLSASARMTSASTSRPISAARRMARPRCTRRI